jgi:hypothetical protein
VCKIKTEREREREGEGERFTCINFVRLFTEAIMNFKTRGFSVTGFFYSFALEEKLKTF